MDPLDPAVPEALARPDAHRHDPDAAAGVEVLQTHLSWVFLTRTRVYKLRKAARLGFVDFGSRAERNADCLREVALNRRLAPDVYLGVAPVVEAAKTGRFMLGAVGEALGGPELEHCVVMRRLPAGRDALSLLEADRLEPVQLDALAERLVVFHAACGLGAPAPFSREAWRERLLAPVRENFRHLGAGGLEGLDEARVARAAAAADAVFDERAERFDARRRAGRVVDGHGDVHLQHVWFEEGAATPVLIDCVEFDAALRQLDVASEVAFLAMDLAYRGRPELAERFLRVYAAASDDFDLYRVVDWFASYRASVRAKVAALAAADDAIDTAQRRAAASSAARHFALAEEFLAPPRAGALVVLCGLVGTGKSSVAAALADAVGGVVIASDRTRKHQAGLAPAQRAAGAAGEALYAEATTEAVYAGLLERAEPVLASGRVALLDATFALRRHRDAAAAWAEARGVARQLVEVRCAEAVTRERLARREAAGRDPSDAGPALYAWSRARFEPTGEWPEALRHVVETGRGDWRESAARIAARLPASWHRTCKSEERRGG